MNFSNQSSQQIQIDLEQRILHGLSCEWDAVLWQIKPELRQRLMKPLFALRDFEKRLGYWSPEKREIGLSRRFVTDHTWHDIREVLLHEMAHQFVHQVWGVQDEPPHGQRFQHACRLLNANPKASGAYLPFSRQILQHVENGNDKIRQRIQKLLALAASSNQHEAESAMIKAHELMAKYEMNRTAQQTSRDYFSVFIGHSSLRHFQEDYYLAHLLMDYYYVKCLWVPAYVMDRQKMGSVLEISGTAQNLQIAGYVFDFIRQFIESEWGLYNQDGKWNRYRKTDFAIGILTGFRTKLEQTPAATALSGQSLPLVAIQDNALQHYFSMRYPRLKKFRRKGGRCHLQVLADGSEIGKTLVIRKGISRSSSEDSTRLLE